VNGSKKEAIINHKILAEAVSRSRW